MLNLCSRWSQFFEADDGRLSMSRLLCFMSFFPSSTVVMTTRTDTALLYYISGYVLGYIGGKGLDALTARNRGIADNGNAEDSDVAEK